jgi:DNA-binding protein H-NS
MPKSLQQVLSQIAKLEKEAKALRDKEKVGVVTRIREAVAHYEITPAELFGAAPPAKTRKVRAAATGKVRKPGRKAPSVAKYTDGTGRTWSGVGKRPNWFKDALAAGKTAEDLLIRA